MTNFKAYLKTFLLYFLPLLTIEILFHLIARFDFHYMTIIRIILFNASLSIIFTLITSFLPTKYQKYLIFVIVLLFATYGFIELEFKNFLDNYYSFNAVGDGIGRVNEYVITFIKDAKISYWSLFLVPLLLLLFIVFNKTDAFFINIKIASMSLATSILFMILSYFSLNISNTSISLIDTYNRFNNNDLLIDKLGLNHYLFKDLTSLFIEPDNSINIIINKENNNDKNIIDDTQLKIDMANEENSEIELIDNYILNTNIRKTNSHTNEFKDFNFIYILVESLDYMAIDEVLTPTLYQMYHEGYSFKNHYTPKFSCTTGESEFIANVSLVPYNDVCTPNEVSTNAYPEALANLFKNAGYDTYSFHNWYDQYYDRRIEHESFGFDEYYNIEDLDIEEIYGWQSDYELIDQAYPKFINSDKFFSFIITSSMHWPYDEKSTLGDKYLNEIDAVHKDYPIEVKRYLSKAMELDKGLKHLLNILKENDKLDNTIICLFSDHNPFKILEDTIIEYSPNKERDEYYGISKTPFLFYNPNLKPTVFNQINSTFDQVPTIANLFGLNYDSRLYIGNDLFNDESLVIFPNSDWINADGIYLTSTDTFIPFNDKKANIKNINEKVANAFNISYAIMNNDYFKERSYLANPKYLEEIND